METLIAWMVSIMIAISPINPKFEDEYQHEARMQEIAQDIVYVAYNEEERPIINLGNDSSRRLSAMMIFAVARHESSFYYNIDQNEGKKPRGDNGRSWCIMQINLGKGKTSQGWTGPELIEDRKKCLKAGYKYMKRSFGACRRYGQLRGLSAYASGSCQKGTKASRDMVNMGYHYFYKSPKVYDETILKFLELPLDEQKELLYDTEDEKLPYDKTT